MAFSGGFVKECSHIRHLDSSWKLSGKLGHKLACFMVTF